MYTYIALFRGINVGGKNNLPMKDVVAILYALNYENIQTYIQSGNVVFQGKHKVSEKSADEIGKLVLDRKGFEPKVLLLSLRELQDAIENNPFAIDNGKALHFFFLEDQPLQPNWKRLESIKVKSEEFLLKNKVFYLYAPEGIGRSKLAANVEKILGVPITARNWNTVIALLSMAGEAR
jgi:uncharacterized protein (DUF1697 family)